MRIAILSRSSEIFSTSRLIESAEKLGHEVEVINPLRCYMNISSKTPEIHYQGRVIDNFDAVIPRIGASITFYGTAVLRQFQIMNALPLNPSLSITIARDKLRAHQQLSKKGIPMPITGFAHSTDSTKDLINLVGGAPLIVKLLVGTQGKGVILTETKKAAESVINAFRELDAYFLVQQFVKEADNKDIRCIVLGDKVVACMQRTAKEGDFRANIHTGGFAEEVEITDQEREIAIAACQALRIQCGGVDIIRSKDGPLVLEVNSSPGLKGIEGVTGFDIAGMIIKHLESRLEAKNAL